MSNAPAILKHRRGMNYGEHDWRQDKTTIDGDKVKARCGYVKNYDTVFPEKLGDDTKPASVVPLIETRVNSKTVIRSIHSSGRQQRGGGRSNIGTTDTGKKKVYISEEEEQARWDAIDWGN